jgi:membrane complex biogenesis BtpA family protein
MKNKLIIGMIHLPVTLSYDNWVGIDYLISKAKKDLITLENAGFDGALIENDSDHPCQIYGTADVVAPMSIVAFELKKISKIKLGIEVLLNDPKASLAIAKTCNLDFIRTDYFIDKMKRDIYGEFKIDPIDLLNYRHKIKADNIKIYADLQVKYATMLDKNKSIEISAKEAIKAGADGIIITGSKTGEKPLINDLKTATQIANGKIPILIGSGLSENNVQDLMYFANGAIVGTSIKTGEYIDINKAKKLMLKFKYDKK